MGIRKTIQKSNQPVQITIGRAITALLSEKKAYGLAPQSIHGYKEAISYFLVMMNYPETKPVKEISEETVLEYIGAMREQELSTATINHYLRVLRVFVYWCAEKGYLNRFKIKLVKGQEPPKETYTLEELTLLLQKPVNDNFKDWRSWAVINWIMATGNRCRTICELRMRDIDIDGQEIILEQTKAKRLQVIPMSSALAHILEVYIASFRGNALPEDYLFCNCGGEKLTENALKLAIRDYNRSRGVERTSIHAFRHTYAKLWIRNSGDVFKLQKMLGHSTLDMTRRYVNLFTEDLKDGYDDFSPLDTLTKKDKAKRTKRTIKKNQ